MQGQRWLRIRDQKVIAAATLAACMLMMSSWLWQGRLSDVDAAIRSPPSFALDVRRASWPELTLLPGIGEMLAKRIVACRKTDGPFRDYDDVLRVKGIGPKTLAAIRPHLAPIRRQLK
jgi:competence protein ComEA